MAFGPVNRELRVESLRSLAALISLLATERQVQSWRLVGSVVCHSVVEAEGSFDLFGTGNPRGNRVYLSPYIFFCAYSSRIRVVDETVALLTWMQVWRANSRVELKALLVRLLGVFVDVVCLVQGERGLSFAVPLLHLLRARLDVVASVDDAPSDPGVARRKVRVLSVPQAILEEDICACLCLLCTGLPSGLVAEELLLEHGRCVGTLRPITVDENVTHI